MNELGNNVTREGYKKLEKKLEHLVSVKRREISKSLKEAASHGDLSENAEYKAAREEQEMNEIRIADLAGKLSNVNIIDTTDFNDGIVRIGTKVKLKDLKSGEEFEYTLVSELEADIDQDLISVNSPVGKGLLGGKENEKVNIETPGGTQNLEILKVL